MRASSILVVVAAALGAPGLAQSEWRLCGSAAGVRIVGTTSIEMHGPRDAKTLPAGEYAVHFGVDALGKPASLAFTVPEAATVQLAVEAAGPVGGRALDVAGDGWTQTDGVEQVRTTGSAEDGEYRLEMRCATSETTPLVGLVARWADASQSYAFVWDRARKEVRLERHLGPTPYVLARAALASPADGQRTLALQVQGFRLQGLVDDEIVLQLFDGALTKGAFGVCWRGEPPQWGRLLVTPPALPRASVALVGGATRTATLHAATTVTPGHFHVLELRLDRPHALVPLDAAGLEPWLLARPAAPLILRTDLRSTLGAGSFGEVPPSGNVSFQVERPDLPALRGQVAMARLLLVTADGSAVSAVSPAVPLVF